MSKKQSEYLADLLADEAPSKTIAPNTADQPDPATPPAPPAPSPTQRAGMSLLGRETALARVASGDVRQITQLLLDPERVRIWEGNARLQALLSEETVRDLIDSILAEGGQKVPVIVRRLSGDAAYDYEVIAGTRRHFAISWLRRNNYPDMRLLAQLADMDDESAFRLADLENRARKDVSDIERARNYAVALSAHYGGKQVRMAERLRLSKGWLSKMIKVAAIPDIVLNAFGDVAELTLNPAYTLATALDDPVRTKGIMDAALHITASNAAAVADNRSTLPFSAVYAQLMAAGLMPAEPPALYSAASRYGRTSLAVTAANRQGLTLRVHAASGSSEEELVAQFKEAMQMHLPKSAGE